MQLNLQEIADGDVCEVAKQRWYISRRWLSLWTMLVFALGVVSVGILILAIVYATDAEYVKAAVSGAASVLDGVAVAWILARRKEALEEETTTWDEFVDHCSDIDDAKGVRQRSSFLGIR